MMLIYCLLVIFLITFIYAGKSAAPWVPSRRHDVARVVTLADATPGMKVYELGAGDGRFVFAWAKQGVEAIGFEISLLPYLIAQGKRLFFSNKTLARFQFKSFWSQDLSDADVVYFFLMPEVLPRVKEKLAAELKTGTKVISAVWPIEGWESTVVAKEEGKLTFYLYEII